MKSITEQTGPLQAPEEKLNFSKVLNLLPIAMTNNYSVTGRKQDAFSPECDESGTNNNH